MIRAMRASWLVLVLLLAAACGGAHPTASSATTTTTTTPSSDAATAPLAPGCPASFAAATGACSARMTTCSYPEGACSCSAPPWCGGAAPPPDYGEHTSWQCTPKVRPGGCPGTQPTEGSPCDHAGQACDYTCSCSETATCQHGRWHVEHGPCKP